MKYSTHMVCIDEKPIYGDDIGFYRKYSQKYAFNYEPIIDNEFEFHNLNDDSCNKIGEYIKKHITIYSKLIKLLYNEVLSMVDHIEKYREEALIEQKNVILNKLEKYVINAKDRSLFIINDINEILNQHSGIEVYELLFCQMANYHVDIVTSAKLNNSNMKKYIMEHEAFRPLNVPTLIYEKMNDYAMTTYIVNIKCTYGLYKDVHEDIIELGDIFKLPSTLSKYETEEKIGSYIKEHIQEYDYWVMLVRIALQFHMQLVLNDPKNNAQLFEIYYKYYHHIIENHMTYDEDEYNVSVNMEDKDLIFFITNVIDDDHLVYELMFNTYVITDQVKYRAELLDITTNVHYATIN